MLDRIQLNTTRNIHSNEPSSTSEHDESQAHVNEQPVAATRTLSQSEQAQILSNLRYPALNSKTGIVKGEIEYEPRTVVTETNKQKRDRERREREIRERSRVQSADINTVDLSICFEEYRNYINHDKLIPPYNMRYKGEVFEEVAAANRLIVEELKFRYLDLSREKRENFDVLAAFISQNKREYEEGVDLDYKSKSAEHIARIDSALSKEKSGKKLAYDQMVDGILAFKFTTQIFEPYYLKEHFKELMCFKRIVEKFDDIKAEYPEYFDTMDEYKKQLLEKTMEVGASFVETFDFNMQMCCIDSDTGEIIERYGDAVAVRNQRLDYQVKIAQLNSDRRHILREEASKNVSATRRDAGYRLGIPSTKDIETILLGINDKADIKLQRRLLRHIDEYYSNVSKIEGVSRNNDDAFAELSRLHGRIIDDLANLSTHLAGISEDAICLEAAASLGNMAMKTATYTSSVRNLTTSYFRNALVKAENTHDTLIGDADELDSRLLEGVHIGELGQEFSANVYDENRSDNQLRKIKGYQNDRDYLAVVQSCEMYENFIASVVIPAYNSQSHRTLDNYNSILSKIGEMLQRYNDQVVMQAQYYTTQYSGFEDTQDKVNAIADIVLSKEDQHYNFFKTGQLIKYLNDGDSMPPQLAGLDLKAAIRTVRFETKRVGRFEGARGGSLSKVYIRENEGVVLREGSTYRNQITDVEGREQSRFIDLDIAKGGITAFEMDGRLLVDTHKAARDQACTTVDELMEGHVIAKSEPVMLKKGSTTLGIGSKMELAQGSNAYSLQRKLCMKLDDGSTFGNQDPTEQINLVEPFAMEKIYMLMAIDYICGSADRHSGNMFLQVDDTNHITSIRGIDNDMAFGENMRPLETMHDVAQMAVETSNTFAQFTPILEEAFVCVPLQVYEKVMSINRDALAKKLSGNLRDKEVRTALERLDSIQNYFRKLRSENGVYDLNNPNALSRCQLRTALKAASLCDAANKEHHSISEEVAQFGNYFSMMLNL